MGTQRQPLKAGLAIRISIACLIGVAVLTAMLAWPNNPVLQLDELVASSKHYRSPENFAQLADLLDDLGRRIFVLPLMLLVLGVNSLKERSWRPVLIGTAAFVVASVIVGALKFLTDRTSPRLGPGSFGLPELIDSIGLYPSGHAANAVVAWGAMCYFSAQAFNWSNKMTRLAIIFVCLIVLVMSTASAYLHFHWVSDLVAGVLVGAAALFAGIAVDQKLRAPADQRQGPESDLQKI